MSLADQFDRLIDDRLYEEAVPFLLNNPSALSPPQTRSLSLLIQSCFSINSPLLAVQLIEGFWAVLAGTKELRLAVAGLLRAGRVDLAHKVVLKAVESGIAGEMKLYEVFVEGALEAKAGSEVFTVLQLIAAKSLPESATLLVIPPQQLATRAFLKTFDLERAAESLSLLPSLPEQLWTDFLKVCLQRKRISLALQVLERLSTGPEAPSCLWNLTLECTSQRQVPVCNLQTALQAVPKGRKIWLKRMTLSRAVRRLIKAGRIEAGLEAVLRFKGAVSSITLSKVLRLLLDKGESRAVLQVLDWLGKEYFKGLEIEQLDLPVELLKQMVALQQGEMYSLYSDLMAVSPTCSDSETQTSSALGKSSYLEVD